MYRKATDFPFPVLVFYVGYVIWMLPSNLALQRVGPANWLSALCVTWGIVTLCVGFVRDWRVLSVLRVVLGCVEAVRAVNEHGRQRAG